MKVIIKTITALTVLLPALSYAAPELIVTWKASSYIPANYMGKALPIAGTPIDISAILIDGGVVASLSPYDINWYAGEDRIAGGKGVAIARVTAPSTGQDTLELRVNVAKYKDQPLDAFITIPIVHPEILIMQKPNVKTQDLSIIPFFWNILKPSDLTVTWSGDDSGVTAYAANKKNEMEFAQISISKQ
ncbi:MAG: hypothetical protein EXS60_02175 [Candidatus Pacebacteria bacterium]|nr:hypothetical protein [Candidatus Paceibacterota bacterium]